MIQAVLKPDAGSDLTYESLGATDNGVAPKTCFVTGLVLSEEPGNPVNLITL